MSAAPSDLVQRFGHWSIRRAVRKLPEAERVDSEVEWLGHLEELPTARLQLQHLVGVWRCAQTSALHAAWDGMTRHKVQEFLIYSFWMVSCMALVTDYRIGASFEEMETHLLGATLFCWPALKFIFKPLEDRKAEQKKPKDQSEGSV